MTATAERTTVRLPNHMSLEYTDKPWDFGPPWPEGHDPDSDEEWLPVPGTDGLYEVSSHGRMRTWVRYKRTRRDSPNIMKPSIGKHGYRVWCHRLDGKEKRQTVHRTVALTFLGDPGPGRWEVRHLDNDKLNNTIENLAWGTPAENAADRVAAGTTLRGEKSPFAKLTWDEVRGVRLRSHTVPVDELAQNYNVSPQSIRRIIRHETWRERPND